MSTFANPRVVLPLLVVLLGLTARSAPAFDGVHSSVTPEREAKFKQLMGSRPPAQLSQQVLERARTVVQKVVRNPSSSLNAREKADLGLASPQQRAQLLREVAGFQIKKRKWKISGTDTRAEKLVLTIPRDQTKLRIFNAVMSPNNVLFMPAGYHSKYVFNGKVVDLWGMYGGSDSLRPNNYPLFATWLSDGEAQRMHTLFTESKRGGWNGFEEVLGPQKLAHGRPGMWPVTQRTRNPQRTGNSCTTGYIRAPVGDRQASYQWIDALQDKVAQAAGRVRGVSLQGKTLLEVVSGKSTAERQRIFDAVKRALPRDASSIDRLRGEVDLVAAVTPRFPMELLHRDPLAKMCNIAGDPVGPGGAKQKFKAADPSRIGVMMEFEPAPPGTYGYW
jgi:hypothetical protein